MKTPLATPDPVSHTFSSQPSAAKQLSLIELLKQPAENRLATPNLSALTQRAVPTFLIQRKVGLEYQTAANLWTENEEDTELGYEAGIPFEEKEIYQGRRKLLYGDKVFEMPGYFHIESDDGEMEFVTEPFEEDQEGYNKLTIAVSMMSEFASLIEPITEKTLFSDIAKSFGAGNYDATRTSDKTQPDSSEQPALEVVKDESTSGEEDKEEVEQESDISTEDDYEEELSEPNVYVGNIKDPDNYPILNASPQASAGIRLDQLIAMFEKVNTMPQLSSMLLWTDRNKQGLTKQRPQRLIDYSLSTRSEAEKSSPTAPVNNLLFLVKHYLQGAKEYANDLGTSHLNYPKIAHPILVRTCFKSIFQQLTPGEKEIFRNQLYPIDGKSSSFQDTLGRKYTEPIYEKGYYDDQDKFHAPTTVLTIDQWLKSIIDVTEMSDKLSRLPGMMEGRGMGAMPEMDEVAKLDQRGQFQAPHKAVVVELRRLMNNVPHEDWVTLAQLVHHTVNQINQVKEFTLPEDFDINSKIEEVKNTQGVATAANLNEMPEGQTFYPEYD